VRSLGNAAVVLGFALCCALILLLGIFPPKTVIRHAADQGLHVEDMAGVAHVFAEPPRRIVFTAQVLPVYLSLTGSLKAVVGINDVTRRAMSTGLLDRICPDTKNVPEVGGGFASPDVEQIARLKPDAVFAWADQTAVLGKSGLLNVVAFSQPRTSVESGTALLNLLAKLSGREERAAALLANYRSRMERLNRRLSSQSTPPVRVLILMANPNKLWIGSRNYLDESLRMARADNVAQGGAISAFSLEDVVRLDPDVILIQTFFDSLKPHDLFDNPDWQIVRAVRSRKIYRLPNLPLFHLTVFDSLVVQWLSQVLHPEADLGDLRDAFREVYLEGYRYSLDDADLDQLLNVPVNLESADYRRFASPNGRLVQ
jgi:iron complex transport system substrate-binding protein